MLMEIPLCMVNAKNAMTRGRNPLGFIGLTLVLWVGLRTVGAVIGLHFGLMDMYVYGLAFLFGFCGGIMSYGIARHCRYSDWHW